MQSKTLYLHVGYPKTGTSALQRFLKNNQGPLAAHDILYPETGLTDYSGHIDYFNAIKKDDPTAFNRLKVETSNSKAHNVLLSSEYFFALEKDEAKRLIAGFEDYELKVIVYVRRVDERVESGYVQVVRDSERRFRGDIWDYLDFLKKHPQRIDYQVFCDLWAGLIGQENLIVRLYKNGKDFNIYSDFLSIFNIDLDDRWTVPAKTVNDRIPFVLFELLLNINKTNISKQEHALLLSDLLEIVNNDKKYEGEKFYLLADEDRDFINKQYAPQNEYISSVYGLDYEYLSSYENNVKRNTVDNADKISVNQLVLDLWRKNRKVGLTKLVMKNYFRGVFSR